MSFHCSDPLSGSPAALKATLMLTGELSAVWPSLPELSQPSLPLLYLSSTHPLCVSPLHVLHLCLEHFCPFPVPQPRLPAHFCRAVSSHFRLCTPFPGLALPREVRSSRRAGPVLPFHKAASQCAVAARLTLVRH